jgi:hypothetical protein
MFTPGQGDWRQALRSRVQGENRPNMLPNMASLRAWQAGSTTPTWSPEKFSKNLRVTTSSPSACAYDLGLVRWMRRAKKSATSGRRISSATLALTAPYITYLGGVKGGGEGRKRGGMGRGRL